MASKMDDIFTVPGGIIADANQFKISYTPEEILERAETLNLYKELLPFVTYKASNNILIVGPPGTGKTVTVRFFLNRLPRHADDVEGIYLNCNSKTTHQILTSLAYGMVTQKPSFDQVLLDLLSKRLTGHSLIILDEVDKGFQINDLLYALSRPKEYLTTFNYEISLVLISNNLYWEDPIPAYLRSSLQLRKINFNAYSVNELKKILQGRIKKGLLNEGAFPEELLNQLTEDTVNKKHSDCRVALKSIFLAAQYAEQSKRVVVTKSDLDKAFQAAVTEVEVQRLNALSHNHFLALLACYGNINSFDQLYGEYLDIFRQFHIPSWKPLKPTTFFYAIEYLDSQALILKTTESDVVSSPPKKVLKVKPLVDQDIVHTEFEKRAIRNEQGQEDN